MNGNEKAYANKVPMAIQVANAVNNYNAFAAETMAGAWTCVSALAKDRDNEDKVRVQGHPAQEKTDGGTSMDGPASRCW